GARGRGSGAWGAEPSYLLKVAGNARYLSYRIDNSSTFERFESSQGPDRVAVEGDEREAEGLRDRDPADVSMTPWRLLGRSSIDRAGPFTMRERPSNRGPARANVDRDPGLFLHLLTDNLALRSLRRNLHAREGPQASEMFARLASDQQDPALRLDQRKGDSDRSDGGPPAGKWDFPFLPRGPREAESLHRASFPGGRNPRAARPPEVPNRLVERAGSVDRRGDRGQSSETQARRG